jgi:hypothetical protein
VRGSEIGGVFHIVWIRKTGFVQGLKLLEGLSSLLGLTPNLNPVCLLRRAASLYNIDDMLGWVGIRWARCAVACEIIQDLARFIAGCRFEMSALDTKPECLTRPTLSKVRQSSALCKKQKTIECVEQDSRRLVDGALP